MGGLTIWVVRVDCAAGTRAQFTAGTRTHAGDVATDLTCSIGVPWTTARQQVIKTAL